MKGKQDTKTNSEQGVAAGQEEARPTPSDKPIEEKVEINKLLDEGYSVKQIIALGFNRRTAFHYAKLRTQPENDPAGSSQGEGPSGGQPGKGKQELIKLGSKDVIPPAAARKRHSKTCTRRATGHSLAVAYFVWLCREETLPS